MIDPRAAHNISIRLLVGLMPGISHEDLFDVRREFARYLTTRQAATARTWQEAWNSWTGAVEGRPGFINYTPARCSNCRGRRWSVSRPGYNMTRTGSPSVCGDCRGTGRGTSTRQSAQYAVGGD